MNASEKQLRLRDLEMAVQQLFGVRSEIAGIKNNLRNAAVFARRVTRGTSDEQLVAQLASIFEHLLDTDALAPYESAMKELRQVVTKHWVAALDES